MDESVTVQIKLAKQRITNNPKNPSVKHLKNKIYPMYNVEAIIKSKEIQHKTYKNTRKYLLVAIGSNLKFKIK